MVLFYLRHSVYKYKYIIFFLYIFKPTTLMYVRVLTLSSDIIIEIFTTDLHWHFPKLISHNSLIEIT